MASQRTTRRRLAAACLALSACLAISACVLPDSQALVIISPNVSTLAPGESVEFLVSVTLDGDTKPVLTSIWDATGGSFSSTTTNPTTYTAPMQEGVYEITVELTISTIGEALLRSREITVIAPEEEEGITITWTGNVGSDWFDPQNWDPEQVPGPNDTVEIPSGSDSIVIGWLDEEPTVAIRALNQHGGTLLIGGADTCSNCRNLVVRRGINAGSSQARIELLRSGLIVGEDSAIHTLAGVWPASEPYSEFQGDGGGGVRSLYAHTWGESGQPSPALDLAVMDGYVYFEDMHVTVAQGGRWVWGAGLGVRFDGTGSASLTIGKDAVVQLVGGENAFGERIVGGDAAATALHVHGRLYSSEPTQEWRFSVPVFVEPNAAGQDPGEIEIPMVRFERQLESHGLIEVATSLYLLDAAGHPGNTLHPNSRTEAAYAESSAPTTISGQLISDYLRVGGGSGGRLTVTDAGLLQLGELNGGGAHTVAIHVPTALVGSPIGVMSGGFGDLRLYGPHLLVVDVFSAPSAVITAEAAGAALSAGNADIRTMLIDGATIEVRDDGHIHSGTGIRGRGQARLRIVQGGTLRFSAITVGPDSGAGGALHFDHLGAVQAWGGQSVLTATTCFTTGPGTLVLPPNHVLAELTLNQPGGCP